MPNLPVCGYYAPGVHALAIKARAVQQEIVAAGATCTGSSAPATVVSSAAAAPLTDLPATQLLSPLPPPLLTLCVRGRHRPAGRLLRLTSADSRRVSSSLIRPTTTDSEMSHGGVNRQTTISRFTFLGRDS